MTTIVFFIYLFLLFLGFDYELSYFQETSLKAGQYPLLLLGIALFLLYIIPLVYLAYRYSREKKIDFRYFIFALVTGMYLTGFIASYGNGYSGQFLERILDKTTYENWSPALLPPLIEEVDKVLVTLLVAYILKVKDIKSYLLLGVGVGLGFQISEDIAYLTYGMTDINDLFPTVFSRLSGSVSSHWLYTGIFTVGVVLMLRVLKKRLAFSWRYLFWLCLPLVSHFLWNSPLNVSPIALSPVSAALSAIMIYALYDLLQQLDALDSYA